MLVPLGNSPLEYLYGASDKLSPAKQVFPGERPPETKWSPLSHTVRTPGKPWMCHMDIEIYNIIERLIDIHY